MKSNATIGAKGLMAFVVVLVCMIFSGYWSISSIRGLRDRFDTAVDKTARKMELGGKLDTIKSEMYVSQRGGVLAVFMKDAGRVSALRQEFETHVAQMRSTLEEVRPLMSNPEGKRLLGILETNFNAWLPEYREVVRLCDAGDPSAAQLHSFNKIAPLYNELGAASAAFVEVYKHALDGDKKLLRSSIPQASGSRSACSPYPWFVSASGDIL